MFDHEYNHHINPVLLSHARELRRPMTPQEAKLWQRLRGKQLCGLKFRRQHPIFQFILDFFCYEQRLAIEIDGDSHGDPKQRAYDQARTQWLEQQGIRVIRFTNYEVNTNIDGVLDEIARQCGIKVE